jgi:PAS domain S-box-containing protein
MASVNKNSSIFVKGLDTAVEIGVFNNSGNDVLYKMTVPDGRYLYVSPSSENMFGYTPEEIYTEPLFIKKCVHPDWKSYFGEQWGNLLRGILPPVYEFQIITRDGTIRWINQRNFLECDALGNPTAIEGIITDITRIKLLELSLLESERKFRRLSENIHDLVCEIDDQGIFLYLNDSYLETLGYRPVELIGRFISELVHPDDQSAALERFSNLTKEGARERTELRFRHKDGHWLWMETSSRVYLDGNGGKRIVAVSRDVSERKISEEKKASALKEKEILLREIHHRVKNNFQIIMSLLNLQTRQIGDAKTLDPFLSSRDRIRSMALVHEKLYRSSDLASIDFTDYIRSIVGELFQTYSIPDRSVGLEMTLDSVFVEIDQAVPCGLIINEIVTNSLKYAFTPDTASPLISVVLRDGPLVELCISDNGIGIPEGKGESATLGLRLVRMLAQQIDAQLEMTVQGGTSWRFFIAHSKKERQNSI